MDHPATRVLAVLELLQSHGRMSGPELARRLAVDPRTIRRYIALLEEMGIPITAERGRDGAYALVAGFKLPPMMFTDDEALALSVGLLAARQLGLASAAPAVESAGAKLERVMPENLKKRVRAIAETVTLDLSEPTAPRDNAALLALSAAALTQNRVHLAYRSAEGDRTERDVDPFGLTYRRGCWYAVGMCHLRQGIRSFRLDRVEGVRQLPVKFARPADFDASEVLSRSIATIPRSIAVEVLLETDLETARAELGETLGLFQPTAEGVLYHTQVDSLEWFARQLARLSFAFEVRRPVELREALRACGERLLQASSLPLQPTPTAR